jgi:hypothetical protein
VEAPAEAATACTAAVGDQGRVEWSTHVNRGKRRNQGQAKGADRPGPRGTWPGPDAAHSSGADDEPPASRRGLTHEDSCDATWSARRPREGRPAARRAKGAAGKGRGRKRRPARNGSDRGCEITPRESESTFPGVLTDGNRQPTGSGGKADRSRVVTPVVRPPPNFGSRPCRSTVQVDPKANGAAASRQGCRGPAEPRPVVPRRGVVRCLSRMR